MYKESNSKKSNKLKYHSNIDTCAWNQHGIKKIFNKIILTILNRCLLF